MNPSDDPELEARLRSIAAGRQPDAPTSLYRHLDDLGTSPRVYYLPPTNRRFPAPGEAGAHTGKEPTPAGDTHGME